MDVLPPSFEQPSVIAGTYRVGALVGRGGWGNVYQAEHIRLGKKCALKLLHAYLTSDNDKLERFRREAAAASKLQHPGICQVFDYGVAEYNQPFYVMEFIDGEPLSTRLESGKMLWTEASKIFLPLCDALYTAHAAGVIHRDLKPSNIIIKPDGNPVLVDFGLAKVLAPDGVPQASLTDTGMTLGTPTYMSPEQCLGDEIDSRSDIYAMGCIIFETLTGTTVFQASNSLLMMQKHVRDRVDELPLKDLPPHIKLAILRTLSKDPAERPQTALELRDELAPETIGAQAAAQLRQKLAERQNVSSKNVPTVSKSAIKNNTKPIAIGAAACCLALSVAGGGYYWWWQQRGTEKLAQTAPISVQRTPLGASTETMAHAFLSAAEAAYRRGDEASAIAALEHVVDFCATAGTPPSTASSFLSQARSLYCNMGAYVPAQMCAERSVARLKEICKPTSPRLLMEQAFLVETYTYAANNQNYLGDWSEVGPLFKAKKLCHELDEIATSTKLPDDVLGTLLIQKARLLSMIQQKDKAIRVAQQAESLLAKSSAEPGLLTAAYFVEEAAAGAIGDEATRMKAFNNVIKTTTELHGEDSEEIASLYSGMADCSRIRGNYAEAEKYYQKAAQQYARSSKALVGLQQFKQAQLALNLDLGKDLEATAAKRRAYVQRGNLVDYISAFADDRMMLTPETTYFPSNSFTPSELRSNLARVQKVTHLDLRCTDVTDADIAALGELPNLKYLGLGYTKVTDKLAPYLKNFPSLEYLDLSGTPARTATYRAASKMPSLTRLSLESCYLKDSDLSILASSKTLRRLTLRSTSVTEKSLERLLASPRLESVDIRECPVSDSAIKVLGRIPTMRRIEMQSVSLSGADIGNAQQLTHLYFAAPRQNGAKLQGINQLVGLATLELPLMPIDDDALSNLAKFKDLEEINLAGTSITDKTVERLSKLPKLKRVNLNTTQVTDKALVCLSQCPNIEELRISQTAIRDISPLAKFRSLRRLGVSDDELGDKDVPLLMSLNLEELNVARDKFSRIGILQLLNKRSLMDINISDQPVTTDDIYVATVQRKERTLRWSPPYYSRQQSDELMKRISDLQRHISAKGH